MSVGLLLVMHEKLGGQLLETLAGTLGELPLQVAVLDVRRVQSAEVLTRQGQKMVENLEQGEGVLILTDAFGATPSNIANQLGLLCARTAVVAGVNLPMLMRICNYSHYSLPQLAAAAVEGGQRGILLCPKP